MYPMKNVQAVLLISADIIVFTDFHIWRRFSEFIEKNVYSNQTLLLTLCDCIYIAV